jgi:GTP-binding protein HflX
MEQTREANSAYLIGRGKAEELAQLVKTLGAQRVIFENALKPIQAYNLAKLTGIEVIDRFQLILEIFAKRATTREAHLQIRLATLRYQLPRAREAIRLARFGEQPGFMGLGRYEVDVYIEDMKRQITHIRRELREVRSEREQHRLKRIEIGLPIVALAGYTNAGKTSLSNWLTKESKPVDLGLFTTLSPSTRLVSFAGRKALLTDTVGFIDQVPVILVEAFNSTLEETAYADAIILVLDIVDTLSEIRRKLDACTNTIQAIGATAIPKVFALNKVDLLSKEDAEEKLRVLNNLIPEPVPISTLTGFNVDLLERRVADALGELIEATFLLPDRPDVAAFVHQLYSLADIVENIPTEKGQSLTLKASPQTMEMLRKRIEKYGGQMTATQFRKHSYEVPASRVPEEVS